MKLKACIIYIFLFSTIYTYSQEIHKFQDEVNKIIEGDTLYRDQEIILFTGSSSIRLWKNLNDSFPGKPLINHGFGGSKMSDLLYYCTELIISCNPKKVFIYEGDNDIASGVSANQILLAADSIMLKIRAGLPGKVPVYFISAKPSKARWHLKHEYISFNKALKNFTSKHKDVYYIDVWNPMIGKNGVVYQDIFVEDDLHMNQKGYAIWTKVIGQYLK